MRQILTPYVQTHMKVLSTKNCNPCRNACRLYAKAETNTHVYTLTHNLKACKYSCLCVYFCQVRRFIQNHHRKRKSQMFVKKSWKDMNHGYEGYELRVSNLSLLSAIFFSHDQILKTFYPQQAQNVFSAFVFVSSHNGGKRMVSRHNTVHCFDITHCGCWGTPSATSPKTQKQMKCW